MIVFRYDKTFDGLLSVVFDAYDRRAFPEKLLGETDLEPLFSEEIHQVNTSTEKAERVWKGLQKKLPDDACKMLMSVWLSEEPGSDELLFRYIKKTFDSPHFIATQFSDDDILEVKKLAQKVSKERLYIIQFARFQKAADGTYFAPVSPRHNVLPLTLSYFTDRFADQKWLIYDLKRKYGYYYDLNKATEVTLLDEVNIAEGKLNPDIMDEDEKLFQQLWKTYFTSIAIKERINPKLHRQHMPKRFWKYLPEKS